MIHNPRGRVAKASVSCDKGSGIKPRRQQSFSSCFPNLFILNNHFHCKHYLLGNCKLCTLVLGRPETTSTRIAKIQCLAQLASSHFNLNFQIPSHFLNFCHRVPTSPMSQVKTLNSRYHIFTNPFNQQSLFFPFYLPPPFLSSTPPPF